MSSAQPSVDGAGAAVESGDESDWETCSESEDGSSDEGDSDIEASEAIAMELYCGACRSHITTRACKVFLCADISKELYSVDCPIKNSVVERAEPYKIATCSCMIRTTCCGQCNVEVGYHVVKACVFCTEGSDNNTQYWMFTQNVAATVTEELYYRLPLNHAPFTLPRVPAIDPPPERLCCVICGDLFFDPVAVCDPPHVFCRVCILRHIDAQHSCPLDRNPLTLESPQPSLDIEAAISALPIRCRYGCEQEDNGVWVASEAGCPVVVKLGNRSQHESTCSYAKDPVQAAAPAPEPSIAGGGGSLAHKASH